MFEYVVINAYLYMRLFDPSSSFAKSQTSAVSFALSLRKK